MKKIGFIFLFLAVVSCVEKLVEKPENLIAREKMTDIYYDLVVLGAAKNTDNDILVDNKIDAMDFIFTKYKIDSVQFVNSDLYYASTPIIYEEIYEGVESRLIADLDEVKEEKAIKKTQDSIAKVQKLDSLQAKKNRD
jgi:hypothetical protein